MPGQSGPGAVASFLAMWVVMMVATMLPSREGMQVLVGYVASVRDGSDEEDASRSVTADASRFLLAGVRNRNPPTRKG